MIDEASESKGEQLTARPLISVVIPTLQPDHELARCVHCILGVGMPSSSFEIVIVSPSKFVADISALYPMAKVQSETRRGIYAAMNDGAAASRGEYLYFMGKDDMVLKTLLDASVLIEREKPSALFCDVYWGARGRYSGHPSRLSLLARNVCHQGIIYSQEAFAQHGPYLRRMRVQADHLLNIKILWSRSSGPRVRYAGFPLAWYSGAGFSEFNRDAVFWRLYPLVLRKYVGWWAMALIVTYRILRGVYKTNSKK